MGVIVELRISAHQFEFGRRLSVPSRDTVELKLVDSGGDGSAPIFSLSEPFGDTADGSVDESIAEVDGCRVEFVDSFDGSGLYLIRWDPDADPFFRLLANHDGWVRYGTGTEETWILEARFPSHDDFGSFRAACEEHGTSVDVERVYNPTTTGTDAWYGLTPRQRRTLELAVERGYYDIPRRCTTLELADELGISDQAVTERLRRGIVTFVTNALLLDDD